MDVVVIIIIIEYQSDHSVETMEFYEANGVCMTHPHTHTYIHTYMTFIQVCFCCVVCVVSLWVKVIQFVRQDKFSLLGILAFATLGTFLGFSCLSRYWPSRLLSHIRASPISRWNTGLRYSWHIYEILLFFEILAFATLVTYLRFSCFSRSWPSPLLSRIWASPLPLSCDTDLRYSWKIPGLLPFVGILAFATLVKYMGFSCLSGYWPSLLLLHTWACPICWDIGLHYSL